MDCVSGWRAGFGRIAEFGTIAEFVADLTSAAGLRTLAESAAEYW
jgi:hypothetical protein